MAGALGHIVSSLMDAAARAGHNFVLYVYVRAHRDQFAVKCNYFNETANYDTTSLLMRPKNVKYSGIGPTKNCLSCGPGAPKVALLFKFIILYTFTGWNLYI